MGNFFDGGQSSPFALFCDCRSFKDEAGVDQKGCCTDYCDGLSDRDNPGDDRAKGFFLLRIFLARIGSDVFEFVICGAHALTSLLVDTRSVHSVKKVLMEARCDTKTFYFGLARFDLFFDYLHGGHWRDYPFDPFRAFDRGMEANHGGDPSFN